MASTAINYPTARRDDSVVDDYHGTQIPDPYRWMEDPDSQETRDFVTAQNAMTNEILSGIKDREKLKKRLTELIDSPHYGCPFKYGSNYFYFHNTGLQAHSVLYMQKSLEDEAEVLLDPNTWSDDGTVSLSTYAFSEDGEYLAYAVSQSGSDWTPIKVLRVGAREKEPDELRNVKYTSIAWTHDGKGFFYHRYDGVDTEGAAAGTVRVVNQRVYYHVLGREQREDALCWESKAHPTWMFGSEVTDDGKYLVISTWANCDHDNLVHVINLEQLPPGRLEEASEKAASASDGNDGSVRLPAITLRGEFDGMFSYVTNDGPAFTFHTNKDAPRGKVVRMMLQEGTGAEGRGEKMDGSMEGGEGKEGKEGKEERKEEEAKLEEGEEGWVEVIGESEGDVMEWIRCVNHDMLLLCYMRDVTNVLEIRSLADGSLLSTVPVPLGAISSSSGRRMDSEVFFSFESFLSPDTVYRCDLTASSPEPEVYRQLAVAGFDPSLFEAQQVFVPSTDGTRVPMFVVSRKALPRTSSHYTLLYAYGGFNISIKPSFSVARVLLMRHYNAVVAIANIRGGGEYGERWHKAGALANKQQCFDDFASCAEYLIREGYTSPSKLVIEGGSNGGLLMGASVNQRPDLFACALAHVGVMDMLRFHEFTVGHAWTSEYGCSSDPQQLKWLLSYSPLHNVRRPWEAGSTSSNNTDAQSAEVAAGDVAAAEAAAKRQWAERTPQYPAVMLLTGDHDDRVPPSHSLKYAAELQHVLVHSKNGESLQTNPIVLRVDVKSGHGAGTSTQKVIERNTDAYSFAACVTNTPWVD
ncbi:hypothetical protein CLOM_g16746 [Closterium sp. NIES-68]|nr:hypothetical protein CLOM_g16746 [Closterium sp. NIES-68]GJP71971.1 hypothetical protein CLOP_g2752 [Closterium sp. NIES-67]